MNQFLRAVTNDFKRSWKVLVLTDICYKFITLLVLSSVVGIAFRMMLGLSGRTVLADEDILYFLLEPIGWISLIIVGALSLGIFACEQSALMGVLLAKAQGRHMSTVGALQFALVNARLVLQLAARLIFVLLLVIAPFLLVAGIIYFTLLTEFDINYYLTVQPPEFILALALGGVLLFGLSCLLLSLISGWLFSLPLVLFEDIKPAHALAVSRQRTQNYRFKLFKCIASWALLMMLLSAVVSFLVIGVGRLIVPEVSASLSLLSITIGVTLTFWLLTNVLVNVLGSTSFAVLLTHLYCDHTQPELLNAAQLGHEQGRQTGTGFRLTKKWLLVAAISGIGIAGIIGFSAIQAIHVEDQTQVIAHRGASANAPENTLAALKQAIKEQADWVEIDVQETAEGEVVVFHDSDFMKLANNKLKIWNAKQEDLDSIDIGSHFDQRFSAERVPTLRQALAVAKGKIQVIIELKYYGHDQQLEQRVAEIVEAEDMQSNVILMSLKSDKVQKMKALRPSWQVGLLTSAAFGDLSNADADFLAVNTALARRKFIQSAHDHAKQVYVWTVNDAPTMSRLISRGVDGLITDKPGLARMVIEYRANMTAMGRLLLGFAEFLGVAPEAGEE